MTEPSAAARPIVLSQTRRPASVRRLLVADAARDGWIAIAINVNAVVFFGLVPLTAGYGASDSLAFLGVQAVASLISVAILLAMALSGDDGGRPGATALRRRARLLIAAEAAMMAGWGSAAWFFITPYNFETNIVVVLMLTTIGAISAALGGRLMEGLIIGRLLLFAPAVIGFAATQPPIWGLLAALAVFGAATTLAVGYAVHVQHLAQAAQSVALRETRDALGEALAEAEANRVAALREADMRERFMHSVTHDLRQPVGALGLYLDEIGRAAPETAGEAMEAAAACVASARSVIDSVAQLALVADGAPTADPVDLELDPMISRLVAEARSVARRRGLSLRSVRTSLSVRADPALLERVLRNLIHNALQYTSAGGVLIGARRRPGDMAEIQVCDTGPGVPDEDRSKIFDAFHQAPSAPGRTLGNIGLGLSIVRDFTAAMGGTAALRSVVGRGSCFSVTLPRALVAAGPRPLADLSVLIVDDDAEAAGALAADLDALGADAETICDIRRMRGLTGDDLAGYEALVLDCQLGEDFAAFDLLALIADARPPALLLSGSDDRRLNDAAEAAGLTLLRKPVGRSDLRNAMEALIAAG